jgi:hypothetical protein
MAGITEPDELSTDSDGLPLRFVNSYHCEPCGESWDDEWSCACDDECPACGKAYSPEESKDLLAPYYAAHPEIADPLNPMAR